MSFLLNLVASIPPPSNGELVTGGNTGGFTNLFGYTKFAQINTTTVQVSSWTAICPDKSSWTVKTPRFNPIIQCAE